MRITSLFATMTFLLGWGAAQADPVPVDASQRQNLALTVYNNNYGLVREVRQFELPMGETDVEFRDVAEMIEPTSVALQSLTAPGQILILEQNYRYDLLNRQTLLARYLGRELSFIRVAADSLQREERKGILVSDQGDLMVDFGDQIEINPPGTISFRDLPPDLLARPTLIWRLDNRHAGPQRVETSYLTNGLSWRADYVAILDRDSPHLDLTGWVTLENHSGAAYPNAELKVVAGDVRRVSPAPMAMAMDMAGTARRVQAEAMREEAFFEYHLYTLPRPTSLANNETKQVSLLQRDRIGVDKKLRIMGTAQPFGYQSVTSRSNAQVYLVLENTEANRLGLALPAGIVRAYQADSSGALQLLGEERIPHTARDERIELELGSAFDVVAERKQTSYRKLSERAADLAYRIEVRNSKAEPQAVTVIEQIPGDWRVTEESHTHRQLDAGSIAFDLLLPAQSLMELTYGLRVNW